MSPPRQWIVRLGIERNPGSLAVAIVVVDVDNFVRLTLPPSIRLTPVEACQVGQALQDASAFAGAARAKAEARGHVVKTSPSDPPELVAAAAEEPPIE